MYGLKYNVKPELLVEQPVEQITYYPTWFNTTTTTTTVNKPIVECMEKELEQQCWELKEEKKYWKVPTTGLYEKKYMTEVESIVEPSIKMLLEQQQPRHIVEKQLLRELLFAEEPRYVEKKLVRELLEVIEPRFVQHKLVREYLYKQESRQIEKTFLREILEQVEPKWVENKIVRELLMIEQQQQLPRFVENKLVRELLLEQQQPRYFAEKQLLRELLLVEEPRFVEKKLIRELLEVVEPRFVQHQLVREILYKQEEPRHIEKKIVRELLEQVEPKWVEKQLIREFLLTEQQQPLYVEKKLIEKNLLTRELLQQQLFEQQPRSLVEKELLRQPFENVLEQTKLMYPFERKEFLQLKQTMPVVFHYPIDMTLPIVERELLAHKVEGRHIFPTSGYLHMVWKSLAKLQGVMEIEQLPIAFEKVEFHRPTIMTVRGTPVKKIFDFKVKIVPTTGLFQVIEEEKVIVTGLVKVMPTTTIKRVIEKTTLLPQQQQPFFLPMTTEMLRGEEIYQELKLKGYETEEELKTILATNLKCQYGEMLWTGKWVPFLEGLIQLKAFAKRRTNGIMIPRRINQLIIDPITHMQYVEKKIVMNKIYNNKINKYVLPVVYDRRVKKTVVGGVEIVELKGMFVPRIEKIERDIVMQQQQPILFPLSYVNNINGLEMFETVEEQQFLINKIKREYIQYYVEECQRLAHYIVKKIVEEQQQEQEQYITLRPIPHTLKQLIEKIKYECMTYQHEPILTTIVEQQTGEFLHLLKTIVEEIQLVKQQEHVIRRVKYLFGENNMHFFNALEQDVLLNFVNVKPYFVQVFKTIIEQEQLQQQILLNNTIYNTLPRQQPWTTYTTTVVEPRMRVLLPEVNTLTTMPRIVELEKKMKMLEVEPRLRLFRSPSEIVLPTYY
jgi:hypothetical protein